LRDLDSPPLKPYTRTVHHFIPCLDHRADDHLIRLDFVLHAMKTSNSNPRSNHDEYWKDAFDEFLRELIEFFAPDVAAAIDWPAGFRPVSDELFPDAHSSATGALYPDRIYEVRLLTGEKGVLFLHCEFQAHPESNFAERMFAYRFRIWLKRRAPIFSFALLADPDPKFRPSEYVDERFGNEIRFAFRFAKILDFAGREDELLESGNVAAILVAIKLADLQIRDQDARLVAKRRIFRILARRVRDRGLSRKLTRFLIQGIILPQQLDHDFLAEVRRAEQEHHMPFVTFNEQEAADLATLKTKREYVLVVARARFKNVPASLAERILAIESIEVLDSLVYLAATADSIDDFAKGVS
jgi:hypothetical protein